ncbi:MAG: hypothetical protein JSW52_05245 [Candidatus Coatesbacteria bacterium]|nr:MAG: hypothetical protein JSW52_05245 [Candidatus Coatesbacteria bacterium]
MLYKPIITGLAFLMSLPASGAPKNIARVDLNGDVIFDRYIGLSYDVREVEISELDGSIYVSDSSSPGFGKLTENGYWVGGFDVPLFDTTFGFDIDNNDYLWIAGFEYIDRGLYKYTSSGGYVDGLEDFSPTEADLNGIGYTWAADPLVGSDTNGIHKIRNSDFARVRYVEGYKPYGTTYDNISKWYWIYNYEGSGNWSLVKFDDDGNELFTINAFSGYRDLQASPIDGGCWFIGDGQNLFKVNAFGAVILRDSTFSEIAAIDVNESDGSVWVASNVPKRLVHLDKDGNRQLYKEWPGGDFAHLAVDQRNGTCIVIYEEYKSGRGDVNIQPASVGEIKAMYAE